MNRIYDLCIVGGGPAGSFLAREMALAGRSVCLLEASSVDKRKICGEYLCPKGVELLENAGLARVLAESRPVLGMRIFSPSGRVVRSYFPEGVSGRAIRRDRFDPDLLDAAREAGAEIRRGVRAEEFSDCGTFWMIKVGEESIRARVLVGADGRQSVVSRRLGNEAAPRRAGRVAVHAYYPAPSGCLSEMHVGDNHYVGLNVTGENEWNLSMVCDSSEVSTSGGARRALEQALSKSEELSRRFLPLPADLEIFTIAPITHAVDAVAGRRWALVGDAAGFLDPLTGEGVYQALLSAQLLATHLKTAFANSLFDFSPYLAAFAQDHQRAFAAKRRLNVCFQWLIRQGWLCELVAKFLGSRQRRADLFLGIVGNLVGPADGLRRLL